MNDSSNNKNILAAKQLLFNMQLKAKKQYYKSLKSNTLQNSKKKKSFIKTLISSYWWGYGIAVWLS